MALANSELRMGAATLALPTGERLVAAAERLFAERGVDAVSLRAVMAAADANVASVHYHFGSKDALIEAVIRRRSDAVAARRNALLDQIADRTTSAIPRSLAEAFVRPVWELSVGEGAYWVKFIAGILGSAHPALAIVADGFTAQAVRFMELLGHAYPTLPDPTLRFRLAQAMTLTFHVLGDVDQTKNVLAISGVQLDPDHVLTELTDVVTAILAGPPPA